MKKNLIASAILLAAPVHAVEVYNSDTINFDIGGNLQLGVLNEQDSTTVFDNGSRFHFAFDSQVNEDVNLSGFLQYNVNAVARNGIASINRGSNSVGLDYDGGANNLFKLRQGFFSANSNTWGEFSIGKKTGAYATVTGVTDYFNVYSAMASSTYVYGDGGITGTGRVDNGLYWTKMFGTDTHSVSVNLQGQLLDDSIELTDDEGIALRGAFGEAVTINTKGGAAASAIYAFDQDKFTFGVGYSATDAKIEGSTLTINNPEAFTASFSSTLGDWYFAGVVAKSEGMYQDNTGQIFSGKGVELMVKRDIGNWTPMLGYSHIKPDSYEVTTNVNSKYELDLVTVSLNYNVRPLGFFAFIEASIDNGVNADGSDSDNTAISVGMYYPF